MHTLLFPTPPTATPTHVYKHTYTDSINCGDPSTLRNGRRFVGGTVEGSVVSFSCNSGFLLVGSDRRSCLANGDWSGNLPLCTSKELVNTSCHTQYTMNAL